MRKKKNVVCFVFPACCCCCCRIFECICTKYVKLREKLVGFVGWLGLSVPLSCLTAAGRRQRRLVLPPETRAAEEKRELSEWECVASFLVLCLSDCPSLSVCLFVCLGLLATRNKCHLILMANVCATVGKPQTT